MHNYQNNYDYLVSPKKSE